MLRFNIPTLRSGHLKERSNHVNQIVGFPILEKQSSASRPARHSGCDHTDLPNEFQSLRKLVSFGSLLLRISPTTTSPIYPIRMRGQIAIQNRAKCKSHDSVRTAVAYRHSTGQKTMCPRNDARLPARWQGISGSVESRVQ